jgi:hypothetical protein
MHRKEVKVKNTKKKGNMKCMERKMQVFGEEEGKIRELSCTERELKKKMT